MLLMDSIHEIYKLVRLVAKLVGPAHNTDAVLLLLVVV